MRDRGEVIRFVRGKCMGYRGWINLAGDETAASLPVIIQNFKKKDGSTCNKTATVRRERAYKRGPNRSLNQEPRLSCSSIPT
jgi:hypothetical protein